MRQSQLLGVVLLAGLIVAALVGSAEAFWPFDSGNSKDKSKSSSSTPYNAAGAKKTEKKGFSLSDLNPFKSKPTTQKKPSGYSPYNGVGSSTTTKRADARPPQTSNLARKPASPSDFIAQDRLE